MNFDNADTNQGKIYIKTIDLVLNKNYKNNKKYYKNYRFGIK